ncbi:ribose-5-phosphate isomerase [Metschnikowia bicuspidata var. bicuspidata NRRL YB-4993]|uniref:Ribose-5-phosphate isomerase n=1 Tax=Metschnikowia bicuspidata var. bicuspidata NRRL YB-4993 TaxID=869754 RepID=A0A1A0H7K5_9ASCO|nr:ribose-5-phosphate isomerase [Metschnikowia bicuspidata var. bicuspidata NRRL YB-4993]OBA19883.1 ribose-5-phosphate isomerase [Metschnikowia bicuspidata var. bicuspidata NRRL YB-4993]
MSSTIESAKMRAAYRAVDENLPDNAKVVGIGSGSTVVYVAERLSQLANKDSFVCIPTGFQLKQLILDHGLHVGTIEQYPSLDIAFDGADECDDKLNLIKGGGACLLQEKLVAEAAATFIIVADYRKKSRALGTEWTQGVPIEIVPNAYAKVTLDLKRLGARNVDLRQGGKAKAGPVITDNNNFLIDADFGPIADPRGLHAKIKSLCGVVDSGLFTNLARKAYFGEQDGAVSMWLA